MKAFLFPWQKALDLRARQLALDEAKFQAAAASVAQADREREILLQARQAAEAQVRAPEETAVRNRARSNGSANARAPRINVSRMSGRNGSELSNSNAPRCSRRAAGSDYWNG